MPRSRFDELVALADDNDGLVTADQARAEGFTDSVLARLVKRGESYESQEAYIAFHISRQGDSPNIGKPCFGRKRIAAPIPLPSHTRRP